MNNLNSTKSNAAVYKVQYYNFLFLTVAFEKSFH